MSARGDQQQLPTTSVRVHRDPRNLRDHIREQLEEQVIQLRLEEQAQQQAQAHVAQQQGQQQGQQGHRQQGQAQQGPVMPPKPQPAWYIMERQLDAGLKELQRIFELLTPSPTNVDSSLLVAMPLLPTLPPEPPAGGAPAAEQPVQPPPPPPPPPPQQQQQPPLPPQYLGGGFDELPVGVAASSRNATHRIYNPTPSPNLDQQPEPEPEQEPKEEQALGQELVPLAAQETASEEEDKEQLTLDTMDAETRLRASKFINLMLAKLMRRRKAEVFDLHTLVRRYQDYVSFESVLGIIFGL